VRRPDGRGTGGGVIAINCPYKRYDTNGVYEKRGEARCPGATHIHRRDAQQCERMGWEKKICEPTIALLAHIGTSKARHRDANTRDGNRGDVAV
jgi:hypothetical protein